jgi:hypothetical protein
MQAAASGQAGSVAGMAGLSRRMRRAKTAGVATDRPGLTSTASSAGNSAIGVTSSPIPRIRAARAIRQAGTSAPSASACGIGLPASRASARKTAAASLDPPPIPAAAGRCFSSVTAAVTPISAAARSTRFSGPPGTPAARGPMTRNDGAGARVTVSRSPTSAKATSESSR